MDVRGVEVTNQLRSAIRAKLLELGVRYDEELPDYILVMVVNKKTRQQMHEDLHLFLENSTTPFVDWLHDQVLKKLQKVTIAKKKPTREFVPTVVVKQEEERKKKKNTTIIPDDCKIKEEITPKAVVKSPPIRVKTVNSPIKEQINDKIAQEEVDSPKINPPIEPKVSKNTPSEPTTPRALEKNDFNLHTPKKILEKEQETPRPEKRAKDTNEEPESPEKRLKSCVNKPKITSVVSVKTRLGIASPRNKFEVHRDRGESEHRRGSEKRVERRLYEPVNRREQFRGRNVEEEGPKRPREESKNRTMMNNRNKIVDTSEKINFSLKSRLDNSSGGIKDRLGVGNKLKNKETVEENQRTINKNIKTRLGPVKSKFIALGRLGSASGPRPTLKDNLFEEDLECEEEEAIIGPVKSHIIAVKNSVGEKTDKRSGKGIKEITIDKDDKEDEGKALASKVIVTPRPLKPLQPVQKRATQSLLLRAVAEANQSVVKQKNPEPVLLEKKPVLKRLRPTNMRPPGQNLAVHLNANKRLVMEKIQVELTTNDGEENEETEPYVPRAVTDEQMGVVMSLFQRGNDNQKFLVTLNGYNNNGTKDPNFSDEEEHLSMEVNDTDEQPGPNNHNDSFTNNDSAQESEGVDNPDKSETSENNENQCSENFELPDELPRKRRKLSPIVYTRSRSHSPKESTDTFMSPVIADIDKRTLTTALITNDKSREKCRYWPNCTLGAKCAFFHPPVPCSAFPGCKFGDKCAYKHPKCKFGLSCTKLGCVFSHPSQQCKYHPFCTKPGCQYLHPQISPVAAPETVRAKFTWRRRD